MTADPYGWAEPSPSRATCRVEAACAASATSWPQARAIAWEAGRDLPACHRPVGEAEGLSLAEDVTAAQDMPASRTSAMDGWAVSGASPWLDSGVLLAGQVPTSPLSPGAAVRVATGSVVPAGAEAVIRAEEAERDVDGWVRPVFPGGPSRPGQDIRPAGEEASSGELLLARGTVLTPPALGLAAAAGRDELLVVRAPRVSCLVLGDELSTRGRPRGGGVRDALGPQLRGWIEALGGEHVGTTHVSDGPGSLVTALREAVHAAGGRGGAGVVPDLVLTTGGTSHGPTDRVRDAVERCGGRWLVPQVAVRPGHPMCLATLAGGQPLVSLPGNPLAACAAMLTLLDPLLTRMAGRSPRATWSVASGCAWPPRPDGHRLVPVTVTGATALPVDHRGPSMLRGLAGADGMLVVPPGGLRSGIAGDVLPLPWVRR